MLVCRCADVLVLVCRCVSVQYNVSILGEVVSKSMHILNLYLGHCIEEVMVPFRFIFSLTSHPSMAQWPSPQPLQVGAVSTPPSNLTMKPAMPQTCMWVSLKSGRKEGGVVVTMEMTFVSLLEGHV